MASHLRLGRPGDPPRITPDEQQSQAIHHSGCPLLIVGGPGTGKTSTLIESAVHRIQTGLAPDRLLMLAYGRERAALLRDQVVTKVGLTTREPLARTFHSFAFSVLRRVAISNGAEPPVLLSGAEQDVWIRELLAGDKVDGINRWPDFLAPALETDGFVRELRDLILRASERNLAPEELIELGILHNRPEWVSAADFYSQYLATLNQRPVRTVDSSEIVVECWDALRRDEDLLDQVRSGIDVVMVDEYQESDPAQRALLSLIAPADLVVTLDPDSAIGRFRGADPEGAMDSFDRFGVNGRVIHLPTVHRSTKAIVDLGLQVSSRIRRTGIQRTRESVLGASEGSVDVLRFRSISHEASYVAQAMRRAHLDEGIPYSQMAVIVRTPSTLIGSLERAFSVASVPINVDSDATALAKHSAVKPILQIAQIALDPKSATYEILEELLFSPYGGLDSLGLRRLRKELRKQASTVDDNRPFPELLVAAIGTPMADLDQQIMAPALRIRALIESARKAGNRPGAQSEDVLWAIWNNAVAEGQKIPVLWQEAAMRGQRRGRQADADLDAVISLFESAERFSQRSPGAKPIIFITELMRQTILADTIGAKAPPGERVEILTVHSAKGREWRFVAVVGVQDGLWPNLRMRGSLLGSERLVEILNTGAEKLSDLEYSLGANAALLDDERRLLHVAITRAREKLLIAAVATEDDQPSQFFNEIREEASDQEYASIPRGLTLTALSARLRQLAESENSDDQRFAALLLGQIASAGVKSANPNTWWGLLPVSDDQALASGEELVRVSPSSVDQFEKCQLRWVLERHGGTRGEIGAQAIGTALHAVVAKLGQNPNLSTSDLTVEIDLLWSSLDVGTGWNARRERSRVGSMLVKFMDWHRENQRKLLTTEEKFDFTIGRAQIRGSIDRLEVNSEGAFVVVDLKTGTTPLSVVEAEATAQLQLYQLAVASGAVASLGSGANSAGAELLYVGTSAKSAVIRSQPSIDLENVRERISKTVEGMSGSEFTATENELCRSCNVRSSCPQMPEGRSVVQP